MATVVAIAQVLSVFAALAAVWYAEQAVVETRTLRCEDRVARLLDLVAEVGESGSRAGRGQAGGNLLEVARHRLRAALKAVGEPLPHCQRLLDIGWPSYLNDARAPEHEAEAFAALGAALDEVAALLVRLRGERSSAAGPWP
jgi:hypothetical protein